jgi:raffinose/stachyose/melibiose transport system permease protein
MLLLRCQSAAITVTGEMNVKKLNYKAQKKLVIILFLLVPIILLIIFSYYPALLLVILSLGNWDGSSPHIEFVGFQNYINLFQDSATLMTFENNLAYLLISFIQIALALYLAVILNTRLCGKNFFKSVIFMPYVLNGVAVAFMFNYMYNYESGPINLFLRYIGLGQYAIHFFSQNYSINFSLASIGMWQFTGLNMVIFLGALQSIPKEHYEAASIDGANFFQSVRYITLPSIKPVISLSLFLSINGAMQAFFEPYVLTGGGPAGRSTTFTIATLQIAFTYQNFGKASAMGVVLFLVVIAIVILQNLVLREKEDKTHETVRR